MKKKKTIKPTNLHTNYNQVFDFTQTINYL
jgi:hypothetical protein